MVIKETAMESNNKPIAQYESYTTVKEENTAIAMGSGDLPVFATPAMCALMENAAMNAAREYMQANDLSGTTVGTMLNITHVKASPAGNGIKAVAQLQEVQNKRLVFKVAAYDTVADALIGEGTHERFIVDPQRFMSKIQKA